MVRALFSKWHGHKNIKSNTSNYYVDHKEQNCPQDQLCQMFRLPHLGQNRSKVIKHFETFNNKKNNVQKLIFQTFSRTVFHYTNLGSKLVSMSKTSCLWIYKTNQVYISYISNFLHIINMPLRKTKGLYVPYILET